VVSEKAGAQEERRVDREERRDEGLTPGMTEFVETLGRYFEHYGIARIGGRILGLLLVAERPLSLDDIATLLRVSRASVSTNIRLATASDLVELVTYPGDRRDYYRMIDDAWGHSIHAEIEALPGMRRIAERGLETLGDAVARERLEEMIDFCDFALEERLRLLEAWRARREAQRRARAGDAEASTEPMRDGYGR